MSDRESKAAENYQAFDQLRNRFGGAKKPQPFHKKERPLRRRDSRLEAPPLKPLVEEGDSPSDAPIPSVPLPPSQGSQNGSHLHNGSSPSSPLKGKLRPNGSPYKTAVQPATDLDTVETASQTSQSSAYFSLSPTAGSITELSDTASIESYNEYDLKKKNGFRTAWLRENFECSSPDSTHGRGWNKNIAPLLFSSMQRPSSAGSDRRTRMRRLSNEVRVPTPQFGSLEDLEDSGSKASLLSNDSDSSDYIWNPEGKYKLGTFVERKNPSIASTSHKMSPVEDGKETSGDTTPTASQENDTQNENDDIGVLCSRVSTIEVGSPKYAQMVVVEESKAPPPPIRPKSLAPSAWERARRKYFEMKQTSEGPNPHAETKEEPTGTSSVQERMKAFRGTKQGMLRRTQSFSVGPMQPLAWERARQKYLEMKQNSQGLPVKSNSSPATETKEEPMKTSVVEERAKAFGGTKRGMLRRTQSFSVGPSQPLLKGSRLSTRT